ncbi:MAG: SPASM domain-containing protein [Kiritimatiellae bacterium]|nr:SPASM domain-containing protein [Kiritimatiellia bacterium]
MTRPFSLLVKPAGADCNLSCPYCFYRGNPVSGGRKARMDPALAERIVSSYLEIPFMEHRVAFQGGEPLLAGEGFFRRVAAAGRGASFSVQTNATLVTDSLAAFFAEEGWLVGVSPHGMTKAFREGYERLVGSGASVNVLQLVTREDVREPERLYLSIRDGLGCMHHQYIECTHPAEFAVSSAEWGAFLTRLFDFWMDEGDMRRVRIRLFDSIAAQLATGVPEMCQFADDCRHHLVVEADGKVYPCDFFVRDSLCLGDAGRQPLEEIAASDAYAAFGRRKRGHRDCPRNAHALDEGYAAFFAHAVPILQGSCA